MSIAPSPASPFNNAQSPPQHTRQSPPPSPSTSSTVTPPHLAFNPFTNFSLSFTGTQTSTLTIPSPPPPLSSILTPTPPATLCTTCPYSSSISTCNLTTATTSTRSTHPKLARALAPYPRINPPAPSFVPVNTRLVLLAREGKGVTRGGQGGVESAEKGVGR